MIDEEVIPQGDTGKAICQCDVRLHTGIGRAIQGRVGEVDSNTSGTWFGVPVPFRHNHILQTAEHIVGSSANSGIVALFGNQLHKMSQIDKGRRYLVAKDAGVGLGIITSTGYQRLINILHGIGKIIKGFDQIRELVQIDSGEGDIFFQLVDKLLSTYTRRTKETSATGILAQVIHARILIRDAFILINIGFHNIGRQISCGNRGVVNQQAKEG